MTLMTRIAVTAVVTVLMAGCAQLSPQQVSFNPAVPDSAVPNGDGASLWVEVEDRRQSNVIGLRGGVYQESSAITPEQNLRDVLQATAERVLEQGGYRFVDMNPDVEVTLSLDELTYRVDDVDAARKKATASAKVSVMAVRGNTKYTNSFRAERSIETLRYPSTDENSDLLNKVFNDVLINAFSDRDLEDFMNQ